MSTSAADVVTEAYRRFILIRTPSGEPYALANLGTLDKPEPGHLAMPLDAVASTLAAAFFVSGAIPSPQIMTAAMSVLSAQATTAPTRSVHLRMAHLDGVSYLDLGRSDGRYVEITETGWTVRADRPPVVFTRPPSLAELPLPTRGGKPADLARILGLSTQDTKFRLMWGWLAAQALPDIARPFLYLIGSQGSGKTTRGLLLANVLEPQTELGGLLKSSERENNPVAKSSFILTADNMTKMSEDMSNWLCSLVTGLKVQERKLYTNAETVTYSLKRSGIFTGKALPNGLQDDAKERLIQVEFGRVAAAEIRGDDELMADLRTAHPRILGALLDVMAAALGRLDDTPAAAAKGYRFVAYGRVHAALDAIEGIRRGGYVDALNEEAANALAETVHEEPDLRAMLRVIADVGGRWEGTATDLHTLIQRYRSDDRDVWWPATAKHLGTRLRNQQYALSTVGLVVEFRRVGKAQARRIDLSMSDADRMYWLGQAPIENLSVKDRLR